MIRIDTTHASTYVKIVHHPPVARRVYHFSNSFLSYYTDYNSLCKTGKDIELIKYLHSGKKLMKTGFRKNLWKNTESDEFKFDNVF